MARARDTADILRALGRFLDDRDAATFEIMNHQTYVSVNWTQESTGAHQRAYQEHQLQDLRSEARAVREGVEGPVGSLVELLRTIGQELDRERVELSGIA